MHLVATLFEHLRDLLQLHEGGYVALHGGKREVGSLLPRKLWCAIVVPAPALVVGTDSDERRLLLVATSVRVRTPVREDAPDELHSERRKEAGDGVQATVVLADTTARDAAQEPDGVRV